MNPSREKKKEKRVALFCKTLKDNNWRLLVKRFQDEIKFLLIGNEKEKEKMLMCLDSCKYHSPSNSYLNV